MNVIPFEKYSTNNNEYKNLLNALEYLTQEAKSNENASQLSYILEASLFLAKQQTESPRAIKKNTLKEIMKSSKESKIDKDILKAAILVITFAFETPCKRKKFFQIIDNA